MNLFLALLGSLFVFSFTYICYRDTVAVELNRVTVLSDKVGHSFKIIHLSDLHITKNGSKEKQISRILNSEEFDLCVFTGDFLQKSSRYFEPLANFLESLALEVPAFAVTGNHDYEVDIARLEELLAREGIRLLLNDGERLNLLDNQLNILGVEDPTYGRADLRAARAGVSTEGFNLLLSHTYDVLESIEPEMDIDLLLCGDTHGGQYYFGDRLTKRMHRFQYLAGRYDLDNLVMYINRGIGTSVIPFRFRTRPEVTLYEVKKEAF